MRAGLRPRADWPGKKAGDAPHIILFPEIAFDRAAFLQKVKATVEKRGYCVVVVSEGVKDADGKFLAEAGNQGCIRSCSIGRRGPRGCADDAASLRL